MSNRPQRTAKAPGQWSAICIALGTVTLLGGVPAQADNNSSDEEAITIVSWGGDYTKSQELAYYEPFTDKTGIPIERVDYTGDFDEVIEQVEAGNIDWQLVDVTLADAIRGCNGGYLEPIPPDILPPAPDGTPAMEDFLPNTLHECAVGMILWSTLFVFDNEDFPDDKPQTVADVFDTETFPGERGLRKTPRNTLEWALMADGVDVDNVYDVMQEEGGIDRAFDQLDTIRDDIRWWEQGTTPREWLADDEVPITSIYNGRAFNAMVKDDQDWEYIWDGQIWEIDLWAIPRGAPNLDKLLEFVAFATSTEPLAAQTEVMSYAPARRSSLPLVRSEYQRHMPTAPANFRNALQNNFIWWSENQERLDERFDAWLGEE